LVGYFSKVSDRVRERRSVKRLLQTISHESEDEILRLASCSSSVDERLLLLAAIGKHSVGTNERQMRMAFGEIVKIGREQRSRISAYLGLYARYNLAVVARNWGEAAAVYNQARQVKVTGRVRLSFPIREIPRGTAIRPNVVSVG